MGAVADSLSPKQRVFVEEYLRCWCGAEAARRAGYRGKPNVQGCRMLANANIAAAISERIAEKAMEADEALVRLGDQARGDLGDFIDITDRGRRFRLNLEKAARAGKMGLLKKLAFNEHGPAIELHDAQAALIAICRRHGLFKDNLDLTSKGEIIKSYGGFDPDQV